MKISTDFPERRKRHHEVLDAKFEAIDTKISALETKIGALDIKIDGCRTVLDTKIDGVNIGLGGRLDGLDSKITAMRWRLVSIGVAAGTALASALPDIVAAFR